MGGSFQGPLPCILGAFTLAVACLVLLACADDTPRDPLAKACASVWNVIADEMAATAKDVAEDHSELTDLDYGVAAKELTEILLWSERDGQALYQALDLLCTDTDLEALGITREVLEGLITDK